MRIITKRGILSSLAERIREEYQLANGEWYQSNWSKLLYEALCNLPADATEGDFSEIMGSDSWTRIECSECQQSADKVVDFGYGDLAIMLCVDCLDKAKKLLQKSYCKKKL